MIPASTKFLRLCRLMCGRSTTFRQSGLNRGCAPVGGGATTAHPAVEPKSKRRVTAPRWLGWISAIAIASVALALSFVSQQASASLSTSHESSILATAEPQDQNIDFSKFQHSNANHARLPCLLCHRREGTTARPALPGAGGHLPCAGCHAKEFANSSSPVCTICHTNTQSGALKSFPRLKSFNVKFDHAIHARGQRVSCSNCHRPSRGGVSMTIPAGYSAHTTCYRCHAPQAQAGGRDISSCGTCHQPGSHARTPTQAAAFKVGFSHAKHGASQKLNCNACHTVRAGMPRRRQVTAPLALNHHAPAGAKSCATCHTGKRAFGGDDFSVCERCHTKATWRF
jgi:c(7)-type cytochrome triheme protein